jgi:anti-anti-sigma factor
MAENRFEAQLRQDGDMAIIDLVGTIDSGAEPALGAAYDASATVGGPLLLGFSGVDFINSTGIALLVGLLARARADGRPVRAWGLSPHYREIFEITRLADFLEVFSDETGARQ